MADVTFDVAIVGAGVTGASIAFHLAREGVRVVLLDRGKEPGAGSTGRATGGYRAQFETAINVRLSLLAREALRRFADEVGGDCGYRPCGYLFLARDDRHLSALRAAQVVQRDEGLAEARMVSRAQIAELQPHASLDGIAGAAFCPTDGIIKPLGILRGYLAAAERLGAQVRFSAAVESVKVRAGRLEAVRANGQDVVAKVFVNACGPWAAQLSKLAGHDLPVAPLRQMVAQTAPTDELPESMPLTIWLHDGFHLRVRDGRVLLLLPSPGAQDPFSTQVDDRWVEQVTRLAAERVPALSAVPVERAGCWAGLYEVSPDRHAIVGPAPGLQGLHLACGASGHGVMHAPAIGQIVAAQILGKTPPCDASALRPERFAEGQPNPIARLL